MRVPAWVFVIGILMIVIGGCGSIVNSTAAFISNPERMNDLLELSKENMKNMTPEERESLESLGFDDGELDKVIEENKKKAADSSSSAFSPILALLSSILYIISGIFILAKKKFALKLFYVTIGISILVSFLNNSGFSLVFTLVIDLVLLLIVALTDKTQWKYLTGEYQAPEDQDHIYQN